MSGTGHPHARRRRAPPPRPLLRAAISQVLAQEAWHLEIFVHHRVGSLQALHQLALALEGAQRRRPQTVANRGWSLGLRAPVEARGDDGELDFVLHARIDDRSE